jgi:PKD repeat protein
MLNARTSLLPLILLSCVQLRAQCDVRIPPGAPTHRTPLVQRTERGGGPLYVVPTVVHMHYGGGLAPLGPQYIVALIDQCNADLRAMNEDIGSVVPEFQGLIGDMRIELRLATRDEQGDCMSGIRYHLYDPTIGGANHIAATLNTRGYLNIHIGANQSFATLPGPVTNPYDHGDVIMFGIANALYDTRTLAHEVGHWAGLYHTFGITNNTGTCSDDYIADTPITAGSPLDCVLDRSECTPGVVENVQNYMDYSNCRLMFTQGQADHAIDVLGDPTLVRNAMVSEANLLATGVTDPSTCAITAGIHHYPFVNCTGTTVRFSAIAEHALVDSVRWTFSGGNITTSTDEHTDVLYPTAGTYPVQLIAYGGGTSAVVNTTVQVDVPNATSNGLVLVNEFPFTEGFEGDFALPTANMVVVPNSEPTWQVFTDAGHASERSLYVPAGAVEVTDTNDIVLGNFDFSTLSVPTVQVKVAASMYGLAGWSSFHLLFRDQCSNIFVGNQWGLWQLNDYGADHGPNYVPSADDQWVTLQASFPEWNMATGAELVLRVVRPAYPSTFTPEPFYLDDVYVGELPVTTSVPEPAADAFALWPNPTNGRVTVHTEAAGTLQVFDARGQRVWQQRIAPGSHVVEAALAPGVYVVRIEGTEASVRLVVEQN